MLPGIINSKRCGDNLREKNIVIVAVDGPAGSGKSSVCADACRRMGWTYINTGFLYRAVAYIAVGEQLDFAVGQQMESVAKRFIDNYRWSPDEQRLIFEGEDITDHLYSSEVGTAASCVAKCGVVRDLLLPVQRDLALCASNGAIVDGRDIGTVVFPDADLKVFMTASIEERAKRRFSQLELSQKNQVSLDIIKSEILLRDKQDSERGVAPLKQAADAITFDTSSITLEASVLGLIDLLKSKNLC